MAAPLDQATRDSIIQQAKQRATASGKSPEQELYNYATQNGYDADGIDTAMGFGSGSTKAWMDQTFKPAPQGNSYTPPPAAPVTPTPTPAATAPAPAPKPLISAYTTVPAVQNTGAPAPTQVPAAPATSGAKNIAPLDAATRASVIQQAQDIAAQYGITPEMALWNFANQNGIDADGIDAYMGFEPGQSAAWAEKNGVGGSQAPSGGGAPATGQPGQPTQPGQVTPPPPATNPFVPDTRIASASTTKFNPFDTVVDPTKTTQGLMNSMLQDPNSEYLKRVRALSMEKMTERGLGSSSMAQGAGVAAAIDAALGIAAPDAQIYANANMQTAKDRNNSGMFNAGAENDTSKFNAGNQNTAFRQGADQQYDSYKTDKGFGYDMGRMDKQQALDLAKMDKTYSQADKEAQRKFGYDKELIAIQQTAGKDIAGIEAKYKNLTQASASATSIANNASSMVNQILLNEKLTGDSTQPDPQNPGKFLSNKQVAIDQVKANMEQALSMIGRLAGDVDLTAFFDSLDGGVTP